MAKAIFLGPDPLDLFHALPQAVRGRRVQSVKVIVKPYFMPWPGYQVLLREPVLENIVVAGKMACLVSERFVRALLGLGRVRLRLLPYTYCVDRIRSKTLRVGIDSVAEIELPHRPRGFSPERMFRLWVSTRYLAGYAEDRLAGLVSTIVGESSSPEVDWEALMDRLSGDIIERYYHSGIIAAEELAETRLSLAGESGSVSVYTLSDDISGSEYNLVSVAAKHHANKRRRIIVYVRRGNLVDYIVIAVPALQRRVRADKLALAAARRGLFRLKIYDAGRNLVEGIASIHAEPEVLAKTISTLVDGLL